MEEALMKRLLFSIATATVFTVVTGSTAFATTAEVEFVSGGDTVTVLDNGSAVCTGDTCADLGATSDLNSGTGKMTVLALSFNGWDITFSATSGSPGCTPGSQCTTDTNISVTSGGSGTLTTYFGDTGFTTESGFVTSLTTSLDTAGTSVSSTYYAYTGALDIGAPTGQIGATLSLGSGTGSTTGGGGNPVGTTSPFDLQDAVTLTSTGAGQDFTVTSTIDAVPEPSSIVLFGAVLFGSSLLIRRRKTSIG
jgi:hypothetical protein